MANTKSTIYAVTLKPPSAEEIATLHYHWEKQNAIIERDLAKNIRDFVNEGVERKQSILNDINDLGERLRQIDALGLNADMTLLEYLNKNLNTRENMLRDIIVNHQSHFDS